MTFLYLDNFFLFFRRVSLFMFSHTHTHIVDQNDFGLSCIFCLNFVTTCRIDQFHFFPCPCIMCVMVFIVDYDNNPWWILFFFCFVLPHWHIAFLFVFDFVLDYYIHSSVWIVVKSFYSYSCNDPIETQKTPRLVVVTHSRLLFFYLEIFFFFFWLPLEDNQCIWMFEKIAKKKQEIR